MASGDAGDDRPGLRGSLVCLCRRRSPTSRETPNHRYASLNYTLDVDPAHARNAVAPGFVRTDLTRGWPRRRRLAGDGGTLCCKSNDGPHRRTGGHRQCHSLLGLSRVRLDHGTDADGRRRTNGLHWTWLGRTRKWKSAFGTKRTSHSCDECLDGLIGLRLVGA